MFIFKTPPKVVERYQELYDLIENESKNGQITVSQLAKYMHCSVEWLRNAIYNGSCPFAFGDGTTGRSKSYIDIHPLWQFATQNSTFVTQQNKEWRCRQKLGRKIRLRKRRKEQGNERGIA